MIVTKKSISRRTILRGIGAAVSLPLLDSMVPALTALRVTAAAPTRRFGVVYVPNGIAMDSWIPATDGAQYELTPILQPLTRFREQFLVVSGLDNKNMPGERTCTSPSLAMRMSTLGAAGPTASALPAPSFWAVT